MVRNTTAWHSVINDKLISSDVKHEVTKQCFFDHKCEHKWGICHNFSWHYVFTAVIAKKRGISFLALFSILAFFPVLSLSDPHSSIDSMRKPLSFSARA